MMGIANAPNRWLRLRQPAGFGDANFDVFRASCEIFVAHAQALLANWHRLPGHERSAPITYFFFPPERSPDRTVVSLPIGGVASVGTRAAIENACSYFLWEHLPGNFMEGLEEGLTETIDASVGPVTNWRLPAPSIGFIKADPELRRRYFR